MHSFYQLHFITDKYIFNNFIVHFALIFYLHKVLFSYKKNELIKSSNSNNTLMVRVKGHVWKFLIKVNFYIYYTIYFTFLINKVV